LVFFVPFRATRAQTLWRAMHTRILSYARQSGNAPDWLRKKSAEKPGFGAVVARTVLEYAILLQKAM
jgi:hypothetical protein